MHQTFQELICSEVERWYPKLDTYYVPVIFNPLERRIYEEVVKLRAQEKLDPPASEKQRQTFVSRFNSQLNDNDRQRIEQLLFMYHQKFAGHRLDIGIITEFMVKLTPEHNNPIYAPSLPKPTYMKDQIILELALMQEYDVITTLLFSKYSSPNFSQKKPYCNVRLLVDIRRKNYLYKLDCNKQNHPVATIHDAAQHMAGMKIFCELDCP